MMVGGPYWAVFALLALVSPNETITRAHHCLWAVLVLVLVLFVGFRHQLGGDWGIYEIWVREAAGVSLCNAVLRTDPGYALLNWLGANWFGGVYFVNLVCASLAVGGLMLFCRKLANPQLALVVAVPYLIIVVYMGYTRQSVAIGFGMLAIIEVVRTRSGLFLLYVTLAALFHKTAICLFVFLPALFLGNWQPVRAREALLVFAYAVVLSSVIVGGQVIYLFQGYVAAEDEGLHSSGAVVRLFQSVLAAGCFAFIAWRSRLEPSKFWVWTIASFVVTALFALSFWKSTLADRVGLYFIPLQLYAFSTFPGLFKPPLASLLKLLIVAGAAASLWVWLNYGNHAASWLPYKNVLFL